MLKGGVLLAAYDARRPTRDIDMQARIDTADTDRMLQIIREIATLSADDGLQFDAAHAAAHVVREEDESTGVRVTLNGSLSTAKLSLHVDVNVGDPVWPAPREIDLPKLAWVVFAEWRQVFPTAPSSGHDDTAACAATQ